MLQKTSIYAIFCYYLLLFVPLHRFIANIMDINEYIEAHSSAEPAYLKTINRQTHQLTVNPRMLSGFIEGRFLSHISRMLAPKRILEIGTFTAYSTLCMAEGLAPDGHIDTIEVNDELETLIHQHLSLSPYEDQITLHISDAKEILPTLQGPFDLIFIDADKREYIPYYNLCLPLLSERGIILADNTLWDGHIIDPAYSKDKQTQAVRAFNTMVQEDTRVENLILPLRDGITLIRKK